MNAKEFKNIFKMLREELNYTQKDIAGKLGVSISTVGMWETGRRLPSPELYEQIADFFNVDIDYLYARTNIRQKIHFDPDGNAQRTLSSDQEELLAFYDKLNSFGKLKVKEYASDLTEQKKYIEAESSGKQPTQSA